MANSSKASIARPDDDYQAQSDADTLTRAEEIRRDKDRHGKAQKHLRKRFDATARAMRAKKPNKFTARAKLAPDKDAY